MSKSTPSPGEAALDTCAVIDLFGGVAAIHALIASLPTVYLPCTVLGELFHGVYASKAPNQERARVDSFRRTATLLLADQTTAETYGRLRVQLRRKGRPIPDNDLWIAVLAVQHGLTLVTRDAHFDEVEGLATIGW